ncbi:type II toxin-antitoxin system RelE/ParE family toxin [Helicobacter sp. L8]|uniref:type II toxin-antitoxin system RelE/ParE family toxin n=1 Tax=Helicobacter sp. L8 TaxID=2316078 RepID=UPI001F08F95B|nr:type II toxin-antitoxin system RelE/ParE family toxin [Helicobacter sp. L8]
MNSSKSQQNNFQLGFYVSEMDAIKEYEQVVLAHFLEVAKTRAEIDQHEMIAEDFNYPHHSKIFQILMGGVLFELRIHTGPGYRLYVAKRGNALVILLCGGDKSTQQKDIIKAQRILEELP